jgi:transcription antitermination factor NusB
MTEAPAQPDTRRTARELVMLLLYAADTRAFDNTAPDLPELSLVAPSVREIVLETFAGVRARRVELDQVLQRAALNWIVSRMPVVDRAILRLGAYELLHAHDVPPRVTINEAVELAKKYSTEKSGAFVNGVLDRVYQTHCPQKV